MPFPICAVAPATANDASPTHTPGQVYSAGEAGVLYRYGQFKDAVTYAAKQACTLAAADKTAFTNDIAGGSSIGAIAAGVCLGVQTQNYYGFVQITGPCTGVKTTGADDIVIGENVFVSGDGTVDGSAATAVTTTALGVALADDDNALNTVTVDVRCL